MRKWQTVQTLIGRTGKENLKRRVGSCDPANIGLDAATKAERIIKADDLSSVSEASKGAAVFYVWVSETSRFLASRDNQSASESFLGRWND